MINKLKCFLLIISVLFLNVSLAFADDMVIVNIKKHIYHKENCRLTKKCKTCLETSKERAIEIYNAAPCKICYHKPKIKHKHHHGKKRRHHKKGIVVKK